MKKWKNEKWKWKKKKKYKRKIFWLIEYIIEWLKEWKEYSKNQEGMKIKEFQRKEQERKRKERTRKGSNWSNGCPVCHDLSLARLECRFGLKQYLKGVIAVGWSLKIIHPIEGLWDTFLWDLLLLSDHSVCLSVCAVNRNSGPCMTRMWRWCGMGTL